MKIFKIVSVCIVVAFLSYFYLYIPTTLKVSTFKVSNIHELTATRLIADPKLLAKSMDLNLDPNSHQIIANEIIFKLMPALSNMVQIDIASKNIKTKSFITTNSLTKETTAINWFFEFKTSWNPIQRWKDYQEAIKIKNTTAQILNSMNAFVEQSKNIYGFDIKEVTLMDTVLITTKFSSKTMPTNDQVYTQAEALLKYITPFQKRAINNPMVTVLENPTKDYTVMVGISINGSIPETANYRIKKMPVNGKMFVADVIGGPTKISNGYAALKNYLLDSKRPSPAVPFELLVTDRRKITDTTKWQTRLYYPVM